MIITSLVLMACGGGSSQKIPSASESLENKPSDETMEAFISGQVSNYLTGEGIPNIRISTGEQTVITEADGRYSLSGKATETKILVTFSGSGFAEHADVIYLDRNSANNILNISLLPVGTTVNFDPNVQQTLTDTDSPASVTVPASSLIKQDGSLPDGEVTLQLTNINPAQNINLMPGEMIDANAGTSAEPALIESFGAITTTFEDSEGNALNLKQGAESTIHIPLSDKSGNPPTTIPLYYYDKASGLWVEEGAAVLINDGNDAYYKGEVSHFSTWNADAQFQQVLIHGCVEDIDGNRLSNMNVIAKGNDYLGSANTVTDAQGNFSVSAKSNSSVRVFGFQLGVQTSTLNTSTNTMDEQLDQCLVSSGGGITVKMNWRTPVERFYSVSDVNYGSGQYLYSNLIGPKYIEQGALWEFSVSRGGSLIESPFMEIFSVDNEDGAHGEELLVIVQFPFSGNYRYNVENGLSEYVGEGYDTKAGFIPSFRRISDSRVELNINGNITVFLPPPGEGSENVNWSIFPPLSEAPNIAWEVFEFVVAEDGSFTVVPLNNWLPQTEWSGQAPPSS